MAENYDGNPLIQAIDARRKAAEEAAAAEPRVLSIKTREAYVPPVPEATKPKRVRKPKLDLAAIEAVEGLLERLRAGEVSGFVGMTTEKGDGSFTMFCNLPAGEKPETSALRHLGGLELMKLDLCEIADFGLEGAPDPVIIIGEGDLPE